MSRGRRRSGSGLDGLGVVDKPAGWTSHDVVAKVRGILGTGRVGHSGTLDPDATGVLLLGVGRVTRLLRFLTALPKSYDAEVVFGVETDTLDASGEVTAVHDMSALTLRDVQTAARDFVGGIQQVPPMVSAVRVGGRRLHELAREGREVAREPRPVTVHRFTVLEAPEPGVYGISVECSSGTYVRSLAADLGSALGGGAHLRHLRRTAIGSFGLDGATPLETAIEQNTLPLSPPADALRDYPTVAVDDELGREVGHGRVLTRDRLGLTGAGPWAVVDAQGHLLAVYESHHVETAKPVVVLTGG